MSDWDDRDIRHSEGPEPSSDAYEPSKPMLDDELEPAPLVDPDRDSLLSWPVMAGALLALVIGLGIYWMLSSRDPVETEVEQATPTPVAERVEPEPPTDPEPEEPEMVLPPLSESDAFIRDALTALSSHPGLASFLITEGLARKIVAAVANVADGENAARHFRHLRPENEFQVSKRPPMVYVDPRSYRRYAVLADAFASLDADGIAAAYRNAKPLLDEAFAELGYPDRNFEQTLSRAIDVLLRTPVVDKRIALNAESVNYTYTESRLESLTLAQKQLLRTGPDNTRKVQAKLRAIANALELGGL